MPFEKDEFSAGVGEEYGQLEDDFSHEKVGNDEKQHRAEWSSTQYTRECNCTLHSYCNPRSTCSNVYQAVSWKLACVGTAAISWPAVRSFDC